MTQSTGNGPQRNPQEPDLTNELNDLVKNLEYAVRSAMQSGRARSLQREITAGIEQINTQFQTLSERGQQAINQAQEVMNQAQQQTQSQPNMLVKELHDMLARGVSGINQQLNEFSIRLQGESAGTSGPRNVPVEEDESDGESAHAGNSTSTPGRASSTPGTQRVSVSIEDDEPDAPATGETTRLDKDT